MKYMTLFLEVIEPSGKNRTTCRTPSGTIIYPSTSYLTKIDPSEVLVHIGCLSGTVAEHFPGSDWAFRLIHGNGKESYISFHALDTSTRELVKSLLKAMQEEK